MTDNIFIFSGTTEGRTLAEHAAASGACVRVFVATEYGKLVMEEAEGLYIHTGRLDCEGMAEFMRLHSPRLVFDATHPYAEEASYNIKNACRLSGMSERYVRVARSVGDDSYRDYDKCSCFTSANQAALALKKNAGNILLTCGIKEAEIFYSEPLIRDRLYIRILPAKESLDKAFSLGIKPGHIIAMEGPFSQALNEALIDMYGISCLVTKKSGKTGGFSGKAEACMSRNIQLFVIDREGEEGISLSEAKAMLGTMEPQICLVGTGMGYVEGLTTEAAEAIRRADIITGAPRMISFAKTLNKSAEFFEEYTAPKVLEIIENNRNRGMICVLYSGDTGFFSGAEKLMDSLGTACRCIPGISAPSFFATKLRRSYSEAALISLHGRQVDIACALGGRKQAFVILSCGEDALRVSSELEAAGIKHEITVGFNLGAADEDIYPLPGNTERLIKKGLYIIEVRVYED